MDHPEANALPGADTLKAEISDYAARAGELEARRTGLFGRLEAALQESIIPYLAPHVPEGCLIDHGDSYVAMLFAGVGPVVESQFCVTVRIRREDGLEISDENYNTLRCLDSKVKELNKMYGLYISITTQDVAHI